MFPAAAAVLLLLASAAAVPPLSPLAIEFGLSSSELSLATPTFDGIAVATLAVLPRSATAAALLRSRLPRVLAGAARATEAARRFTAAAGADYSRCALVHAERGDDVAADARVAELLARGKLLALRCGGVTHPLVPFRAPPDHDQIDWSPYRAELDAVEKEYPRTLIEIAHDTIWADAEWAISYLRTHFGPLHPFNTYSGGDTGIYELGTGQQLAAPLPRARHHRPSATSNGTRLALAGDWGAGTRESAYVAKLMMQSDPHYTVHIGDIYFVCSEDEVRANALGIPPPNVRYGVKWPHGSLGALSMNGNHEMISRGWAYFDVLMPTLGFRNASGQLGGQKTSYQALENEYWRVIVLDTGYHSYDEFSDPLTYHPNVTQPDPVVTWLRDVVKLGDASDKRGIILFSHHQYNSAFDEGYTGTANQISDLIGSERSVVWFFGHEHKLAWYKLGAIPGASLQAYSRCVGNGGFPTSHARVPSRAGSAGLELYDNRVYQVSHGMKELPTGFNGWLEFAFNGPDVVVDYKSLRLNTTGEMGVPSDTLADHLVRETFTAHANGSAVLSSRQIFNSNLTIVADLRDDVPHAAPVARPPEDGRNEGDLRMYSRTKRYARRVRQE